MLGVVCCLYCFFLGWGVDGGGSVFCVGFGGVLGGVGGVRFWGGWFGCFFCK